MTNFKEIAVGDIVEVAKYGICLKGVCIRHTPTRFIVVTSDDVDITDYKPVAYQYNKKELVFLRDTNGGYGSYSEWRCYPWDDEKSPEAVKKSDDRRIERMKSDYVDYLERKKAQEEREAYEASPEGIAKKRMETHWEGGVIKTDTSKSSDDRKYVRVWIETPDGIRRGEVSVSPDTVYGVGSEKYTRLGYRYQVNWSSFGYKTVAQAKLYNEAISIAIGIADELNGGDDFVIVPTIED